MNIETLINNYPIYCYLTALFGGAIWRRYLTALFDGAIHIINFTMENGSTITSATAGCFRMLWFIQVPGPRQNGESTEAPSSSHSTPISSTAALAGRKIMLVRSAPWTPTINMTLWSTSTFSWKEGNYQWPQLATGMIIIKHHPNRLPKWWIQPMGLKRTLAQQIQGMSHWLARHLNRSSREWSKKAIPGNVNHQINKPLGVLWLV